MDSLALLVNEWSWLVLGNLSRACGVHIVAGSCCYVREQRTPKQAREMAWLKSQKFINSRAVGFVDVGSLGEGNRRREALARS